MTEQELLKKYNIPAELIEKYQKFCRCSSFQDADVENMSMIMTLYGIGFDDPEAEKYLRLSLSDGDTAQERMEMLTKKRENVLSAIHSRQKQLDGIDYLRYQISKESRKDLNLKGGISDE